MKVSILVPIYGVEKYIEQCAISLFSQTYEDVEYIFVNDCTPDNSISILEKVLANYPERKSQTKIINHPENRGLGAGRKTALAASTGEFILNVDSDDYIPTDAIEKLVAVQKETNADIVSGAFQFLTTDGALIDELPPHLDKQTTLRLLLTQNTILNNIWGRLIRRSLYSNHQIDSIEGINMAEDYGLTTRLVCAATRLAYTDNIVYVYRQSSASSTFGESANPQHIISILKANDAVINFVHAYDKEKDYAFAMELGLMNAYHTAIAAGFSEKQITGICNYKPKAPLFRLLLLLFAHKRTERLLRFSYLMTKWCYKKKLNYHD